MFTVENTVSHVCSEFQTEKEANAFKEAMEAGFGQCYIVYPSEPEEVFPGMCERCGEHPAEKGDFICMECISLMMLDMENDNL